MKSWAVALFVALYWVLVISPPSSALHEANHSSLAAVNSMEKLCSGLECTAPNSRSRLNSPRRLLSRTVVSLQKLWTLVLNLFGASSPTRSSIPAKTDPDNLKLSLLSWGGRPVSDEERLSVAMLRAMISTKEDRKSRWLLGEVLDVEVLRFLRARDGNVERAWAMIEAHDRWRVSSIGAESSFIHHAFNGSALEKEVFWVGHDSNGCATLAVRSQVHDGYYYNNDPSVYVSHLVKVLEDGKRRFGVGISSQVCVLLDRGGTVWKNGHRKVDVLDMNVIPRLVDLFRHLYSTLMDHYPDLLNSAHIVPASWFFSMCYKVTSGVMTPQQRAKFHMINGDEIEQKLHPLLAPALLPEHLGGNSSIYTSHVHIHFDPETSLFPIDRETIQRYQLDLARATEARVWYG